MNLEMPEKARSHFGIDAILNLLRERKDMAAANSKYRGMNWYRHHLGSLRTVGSERTRVTHD